MKNVGTNPLFYAHHLFLNGEEVKDVIIPNNITSINDGVFDGCSELSSVVIPDEVTSIDKHWKCCIRWLPQFDQHQYPT